MNSAAGHRAGDADGAGCGGELIEAQAPMDGCRSGVCWKAPLDMRATASRSPAALQASSRWCAMISCGIAKPPRCFFREARPRRPANGSPTPTWRARCNRSRMTGGRAFTRGRSPPRWRAFSEENAACSGLLIQPQQAICGEPLVGRYRDVTIFDTPPPTRFYRAEMLNLLEPHELHRKDSLGPNHVDLLVQAKQIAYDDRDQCSPIPRLPMCRSSG